jgi:NAD(P)H-hydrate repair Nnr-like enzyme with NAD(P)H-hydrate dehydratase domain
VAVAQVLVGQRGGQLERVGGVGDAVVGLVGGLEAAEDLDRLGDGGLEDLDLLEAAGERLVALERGS